MNLSWCTYLAVVLVVKKPFCYYCTSLQSKSISFARRKTFEKDLVDVIQYYIILHT